MTQCTSEDDSGNDDNTQQMTQCKSEDEQADNEYNSSQTQTDNKSKLLQKRQSVHDIDPMDAPANKRRKLSDIFIQLESQINETFKLTNDANERYLLAKKKEKDQTERANNLQKKYQDLCNKLKDNHNTLLKLFED